MNLRSRATLCALIFALCVSLCGCDAFVRKFTRKPKKDKVAHEELVLAPEEYKGPQITKEEKYRQSFLFWRSWQDELLNTLSANANRKKQVDCAEEALNNLLNLRPLLNQKAQKKMDTYIDQLVALKGNIARDIYNHNAANNHQKAERIKRNILRDFSYQKIKDYLQ